MADGARTAQLVVLGLVAGVVLGSAVAWGRLAPRPSTAEASVTAIAATPATASAASTTTTRRPTTTTTVLPPPPKARPLPPEGGRLAPVYSRLPVKEKVVFLGIDDGAVRDPAVLDHFAALHIPFTVFLTMGPAQEDPAFWKRAMAVGGTIESHTLTHPDLPRSSAATQRNEICGTLDPYEKMFGKRPTLFRPPYGNSNDSVRRQAAECGYKGVILWKGSTNNGRLTMQDGPLHAGDILLLHWRDTLHDDVDDVVARCRQEGFTVGRLEDYFPA